MTTRAHGTLARALVALGLALGLGVLVGAAPVLATTKPAGDLVPAGATVLYWQAPSSGGVSSTPGGTVVTVTKPSVIAAVRALINSLPVTTSAHRVCPDDMMVPTTVSFAASASSAPFTKVLFQLGGCPYARVYQHGVAVAPTLGGAHLSAVYARIRTLVTSAG